MKLAQTSIAPLTVKLVGEIDHTDFAEAVERIRAGARLATNSETPELIVIAQSRPGAISEPAYNKAKGLRTYRTKSEHAFAQRIAP